jgi:type-F conjugative transfer system pilin assembly protein TrbC
MRQALVSAILVAVVHSASAGDALLDNPVGYSENAITAAAKQAAQRREATRTFAPRGLTTDEVRSMQGVDPDAIASRYSETIRAMKPADNELYVLVSDSVPFDNLKRLAIQTRLAGGKLVFRGVKGGLGQGAYERFASWISPVIKESSVELQIDPNVFRRFDVRVVPTIIVASSLDGCNKTEACEATADLVAGDVTLGYALEHLSAKDSPLASSAQVFLERLKKREQGSAR